ncbi:hypothetical protein GCM10009665_09130 [Kitasatospora nipponensis]|uniref:DUF1360 domain-containing protein n=1 Tax=Kitasatospora nipponensis TaxID=258049 RepID=A0ABN1VRY8_9ACTN
MSAAQPSCPHCGGGNVSTARQVHERTVPVPATFSPALLAPPTAPPPPGDGPAVRGEWRTGAKVCFWIGLGLGVLAVFNTLANSGANAEGFPASYQRGYELGRFVLPVILLLVAAGIGRDKSTAAPAAVVAQHHHRLSRDIYTRRLQVWEFARVCLDCPGAFFEAGVLRADVPASPLIELRQFPLMVATMADRVHAPAG